MAQTNDGIFLRYDPLVAGEIRILVIRRSQDFFSEIQCHLVHEPLPGKKPYDALSYTWGTDPPTDCVTINGSKTLVRKNLYHALRRFRRKKTERRVWIDAICINQSDIDERNSQVGQMRDIYVNAKAVLIWLGADPDGTGDAAFRFIPRLTRYLKNLDWSQNEDDLRKLFSSHFIRSLVLIWWLLRRPWWERVWTFQEVVVSKRSPNFYCGQGSLNWNAFEKLVTVWTGSDLVKFALQDSGSGTSMDMFVLLQEIFTFVSAIRVARLTHHTNVIDESLHLLMIVTHSHLATDPRDKIFALLGLVRPPFPLEADYHRSLSWVNISTMKQLLLLDGNLRAFGLREGRVEGTDPKLPLWVCDFSDIKHGRLPTISSKMGILIEDPDNFRYAAASRKFLTSPEFEDGGCVLVLRGVIVDSILTLGEAPPAPTNFIADVESGSIRAILGNWMSIAGVADFEDRLTNSDIAAQRDKFWRIMCLDCTLATEKRLPKDIVLDASRREEHCPREDLWLPQMA
jgi:hypothetical protein